MATFTELGQEYGDFLENNSQTPNRAIQEIVTKINSLRFTESKDPLSVQDKLKIIAEIEAYLQTRKKRNGYLIVESHNSTSYIDLVNQIRELIKK